MSEQKNYGPACIGNVIRIIDDRTVIVNVGKDRLSVGDKIVIYEVGEPLLNFSEADRHFFTRNKIFSCGRLGEGNCRVTCISSSC